jgi:hypothetical protein
MLDFLASFKKSILHISSPSPNIAQAYGLALVGQNYGAS